MTSLPPCDLGHLTPGSGRPPRSPLCPPPRHPRRTAARGRAAAPRSRPGAGGCPAAAPARRSPLQKVDTDR